jgi:hypothetical protein
VTLTATEAGAFLSKLADDDGFRQELEADPVTVLSESGIDVTAETLPTPFRLPSKQALADFRSGSAQHGGFGPIQFSLCSVWSIVLLVADQTHGST